MTEQKGGGSGPKGTAKAKGRMFTQSGEPDLEEEHAQFSQVIEQKNSGPT